jgi:hypothetical protein
VQILNEPKFQVARRVIGVKGANMKRIIEECNKSYCSGGNMSNEPVKLRLRGNGSGFLEGPDQVEDTAPLNLCVSSRDQKKYEHACQEVIKILKQVYNDYKFFDKKKLGVPKDSGQNLKVMRIESITGPSYLLDLMQNLKKEDNVYNVLYDNCGKKIVQENEFMDR